MYDTVPSTLYAVIKRLLESELIKELSERPDPATVRGSRPVLVAVGVAIGLVGAGAFTRFMQSLMFGVSPLDPITFTAMPIVLAAAAVLASYLPARRAAAVDPIDTLRAD